MSYVDRVAYVFKSQPGVWLDGMVLAQVGGIYAWRSRISDCRRKLGMDIQNRERRVGRRVISEYRYTPKVQPEQAELFHQQGAA